VLIDWESIPWDEGLAQPGYRGKSCMRDGQEAWLGEFTEGFDEGGWCLDGHLLHIVEGESSLRFKDGGLIRLRQGDSGIIPAGEAGAHRVEVAPGERVVMVGFERG